MAAYNDAAFRAQFPAFVSTASYPEAALSFAWTMATNWISTNQASWGLGSGNTANLQQAVDLMAAVLVFQLYGPGQQSGGGQNTSTQGGGPGPVESAGEGSVNVSFKIPEFGSSAFRSFLLSSPPYGPMLLALIQISQAGSPYIASGRPSWVPP